MSERVIEKVESNLSIGEKVEEEVTSLKKVDMVVELLSDGERHTRENIGRIVGLSKEQMNTVLEFLSDFEFIEFEQNGASAKITKTGLSFLRLPSEC